RIAAGAELGRALHGRELARIENERLDRVDGRKGQQWNLELLPPLLEREHHAWRGAAGHRFRWSRAFRAGRHAIEREVAHDELFLDQRLGIEHDASDARLD